jgi:toxin ParE1/3/4
VSAVLWAGPALRELEEALDYIALDNPRAAEQLGRKIHAAVSRLEAFPDSGRIVPELGDPLLREVIHEPFRVIYERGEGGEVRVLAVVRAEREPNFVEIQER